MNILNYSQLGYAFAKSLMSYKLDGKPHPFSASFVVTNQCNIHCSYCNFPMLKDRNLDLQEIELLFNKLKKMGVKRLGLLGGEPLYRGDILDIIEIARQLDFFISLNTNLLMYRKYKGKLNDIGYFFTSIDGTPETHMKNRGQQSFDKIINAIKDIRLLGKPLTIICVINRQTKEDVDYLLELADTLDVQVHFQPECYDTTIVNNKKGKEDHERLNDLWRYIFSQKQKNSRVASSREYLKKIIAWDDYNVSAFLNEEKSCSAGLGFLFVDSAGYAYPCAFTKGKIKGVNLLEENWDEVYDKKTPCTDCIVGPMLEFNLLFDKPVRSSINILKDYL